ncbi:thiamine pyrophosphate-binding protein [Colwellia sp. 1_MG-2023]|uniref:thiamine pyrophosphate-binding protein n=1 Tax=Colwellia sp. 1_MG-2023 TaxID=3062649 RepID=UPI0026E29024|nr:thiamine pyrophosphate-binding protein [Colwellia sp. 1_MG-2023]MDO6446522.1 thiamine pyrophosphate-binding protein [Colwellia sp. 1_MG-2023]
MKPIKNVEVNVNTQSHNTHQEDIKLNLNVTDYADLIVEYLHQLGVEYVFGVPGGAIEPFYNALARSARRGGPKAVIARHECGAAFMADGYYRETGRLGVVCSTTGPGATNLITGVASASVDKSPMLVITAQTALPKFGKKPLQDSSETAIDTVAILRNCTKFNSLISHPAQLESKLISALMETTQSPRGPAHISIPSDVLRSSYPHENPNVHVNYLMNRSSLVDKLAVEQLIEEVISSDNIVLFIGHGCGRAYPQIQKLAESINAPFVTGPMGKSWVDERHPLYRGVYGYAGHKSARELFKNPEIELVLAIGTSITEMGLGNLANDVLNKLIHIDETVESFSRSPMAKLHVCGHLDIIFNRLLNAIDAKSWQRTWCGIEFECHLNAVGGYIDLLEPEKCHSNESPIKPQKLMSYLSRKLPVSTRVFIDTGNIWAWATHYLSHSSNAGLYRVSMEFGSMAWAIGAVIGSAFASPKKPHVCISGDGAWLMSSHEIGVAVQQNLPILFIVLNDSAYGMIRFGQQLSEAESIGWELNEVDFAALAKAQGAEGHIIEKVEELHKIDFDAIFKANVPTLLDVRIDPNEVPPMMSRIKNLAEDAEQVNAYE